MELGKVIKSLNTGLNPRKFFQLNTPDAEFYYVTIKEMVNGKIVYNENTDRLNAKALRLCNNRSNLEKGDVLFTGTGTIGKTVVLTETPTTWNIKEGVYTIKPIPEKLDSNYLAFALSSTAIRSKYMTNVAGGTVKSLKMADLEKTDIPLPSLPEQQKIAAHLDSIQSAIDNKKQQLQQLDELVKSKFVEMFGDPIINEKGWELKKLGDLFLLSAGGTPSTKKAEYWENGTIPWIGSNLCQNVILKENDGKFITQEGYENSSAKLLKKGTVLVALVGATIGKVALLDFDTTTNQNVLGIQNIREANCNPYFVYFVMLGLYPKFMDFSGGKFAMASKGFVSDLELILPSIELQNTFAEYVQKIDSAKSIIKTQLADLQELLDSKMDEYFV